MSTLKDKSSLTLGVPTLQDVEFVAAMLRPADRRDMEGLQPGRPVRDVIMDEVRLSRVVYGVYLGGVIHALFGVVPCGHRCGMPWLVATTGVERDPLPFARVSRRLLDMVQKCFPLLDTRVCAENSVSMNWHRWCGFEFEAETVRLGRDEYYRAVRGKNDKNIREEE